MPQITALKLVDRAILPAMIIIAAKVAGIFIGSLLFNIAWVFNLSPIENNFLIFQFQSSDALSTVVNFSDTLLVLTSAGFLSWYLFKANHLNIDKTHPTIISKLFNKGKNFWLTTSGQIVHEITIWLGLSWLILFMVLGNVYQDLTTSFVLGLSLATTLGLTFIFYQSVRKS